MRPKEIGLARQLEAQLRKFDRLKRRLPGITASANRNALVEQLVESIRRIKYVSFVKGRKLSDCRANPSSDLFDPLKAAVLRQRQGQIEEAFWLVFFFVHFGKHRRTGWRLARDVYSGLGSSHPWDWARTNAHPKRFRQWLATHQSLLHGGDGIARHFGNHRKYQSLDATSNSGTGAAVESYIQWVKPPRTHEKLISEAQHQCRGDPRQTFDYLYRSMNQIRSFGRTARFDYLTMLGKLGLARIEPGSTYMQGATGPLMGARLLFGGSPRANIQRLDLDAWLVQLEADLDVGPQGMQVLEDALCNWQKCPQHFKAFRG